MIEVAHQFIDLFLHLDVHLSTVIQSYGTWTYAILFMIIFCETGLVVAPILPGDSLLFAAGTFAAKGDFSATFLIPLLIIAAILGDALNYSIGRYLGPKVLQENSRIFKKEYLNKTQKFYERYGGKTIIFARFVPIVRTFAPFLAGVGKMKYTQFAVYNVVGGIVWIVLFVLAGLFFGNIPAVKHNFTLVILAIIILSILPAVFETMKAKCKAC
ncbi:MAG: DedA family protein [Deltaproteobacteria bacterium]|nr:DedA family protein [Deltaproteobacteria bacterium]